MTKINSQTQQSLAYVLAQNLDAKDGKCDGKISANIWNEFVAGKGGKTIKNSITLENATRSISTYLAKNSQSTGKSKDDLGIEWLQQDLSVDKARKNNSVTLISFMKEVERKMQEDQRKEALKPESIDQDANAVAEFVTGKREQFFVNPDNGAQVFLKTFEKFKDGKFPITLGTSLYLMSLYPILIKKAKALGITTNYQEDQKFGDFEKQLAACRDLAMQISDKENGISSWHANV